MWSTVVMSTGLVLLMGCAMAAIFLLHKQLRHGMTSFGALATSDSVLSTMIGAAFLGLSLSEEDSTKGLSCSTTVALVSASTFLISFVNSFFSMLLMALECWHEAKTETEEEESRGHDRKKKQKSRLTVEIATQWLLPILTIVILHHLTPSNMDVISRQRSSNSTCQMSDIFPAQMNTECYNGTIEEADNNITSNLTYSVVQRIYELINDSVRQTNPGDETTSYGPSQPQTREEWKNVFMHLKTEGQEQVHRVTGKERLFLREDISLCDASCIESLRHLQTYFMGVLLSIYIVPMTGTALLYRSTRLRNKYRKTRINQEEQEAKIHDQGDKKKCHLKEIKMMAISNFAMWTPTIIERFVRKLVCNNPPQWLVAILFILGQMSMVARVLITANTTVEKPLHKNVVVPMNSEPESAFQESSVPCADNMEMLFHKRVK